MPLGPGATQWPPWRWKHLVGLSVTVPWQKPDAIRHAICLLVHTVMMTIICASSCSLAYSMMLANKFKGVLGEAARKPRQGWQRAQMPQLAA
jgi:hypothetical protein